MRALAIVLAAALAALAFVALVWRRALWRLIRRREDMHAADMARMQARIDRAENRTLETVNK